LVKLKSHPEVDVVTEEVPESTKSPQVWAPKDEVVATELVEKSVFVEVPVEITGELLAPIVEAIVAILAAELDECNNEAIVEVINPTTWSKSAYGVDVIEVVVTEKLLRVTTELVVVPLFIEELAEDVETAVVLGGITVGNVITKKLDVGTRVEIGSVGNPALL
jgi:hypothetical protein